jgi:hypothetical protein
MTRDIHKQSYDYSGRSAEQFEALKAAERSERDIIMRPDGFLLDCHPC